ncbi:MAG: SDR family NAD(P)-dependent oxidoreductase [Candidatus Cloacimonetes bacterium]|nr:SDR family NAD(P)-dependent oxidoreductase [Candidatus Cloacimonadota bacterium]MDD3097050.1 SDR family NAD(P)-dependent oxidoreductase [Candidatus Cloacimonadota bacterium]MDD4667386.1 SDR family NAD(P)-dependent oxidoreductase [Candidatus Cloacimonadota bacterium]
MKLSRILISGANSQIGSFLAKYYSAKGHPMYLLYHHKDDRIREMEHPRQSVDLRDYAATSEAITNFGTAIDVLIHCAAIRSSDALPLAETDPAVFKSIFDGNMLPAYNILRSVLPGMRNQGFGRVVLFSSDITRTGLRNGSAYAAAKAAIANLAKSASLECIADNVLINCVAPGPVESILEEDFSGDYLNFRKQYFQRHIENSASHLLITKAEISAAVDLLIDPRTSNLCGEEIFITGGKP